MGRHVGGPGAATNGVVVNPSLDNLTISEGDQRASQFDTARSCQALALTRRPFRIVRRPWSSVPPDVRDEPRRSG